MWKGLQPAAAAAAVCWAMSSMSCRTWFRSLVLPMPGRKREVGGERGHLCSAHWQTHSFPTFGLVLPMPGFGRREGGGNREGCHQYITAQRIGEHTAPSIRLLPRHHSPVQPSMITAPALPCLSRSIPASLPRMSCISLGRPTSGRSAASDAVAVAGSCLDGRRPWSTSQGNMRKAITGSCIPCGSSSKTSGSAVLARRRVGGRWGVIWGAMASAQSSECCP